MKSSLYGILSFFFIFAFALMVAPTVSAQEQTINFDEGVVQKGDTVSNQYEPSAGVTFLSSDENQLRVYDSDTTQNPQLQAGDGLAVLFQNPEQDVLAADSTGGIGAITFENPVDITGFRFWSIGEVAFTFNTVGGQTQIMISGAGDGEVTVADVNVTGVTSLTFCYLESGSLLSFSYIGDQPIPVELADFEAKVSGNSATLSWSTMTETNNQGFYVERESANGWIDEGGLIEEAGNSSVKQPYSFTVENLAAGTHTFRLRQEDLNGTDEIVARTEVEIAASEFALKPDGANPFRSQTAFKLQSPNSRQVTAEVYDLLGRRVRLLYKGQLAANESRRLTIDGRGLASGQYFVRVIDRGSEKKLVQKIIHID